jgi:hypothetical protein
MKSIGTQWEAQTWKGHVRRPLIDIIFCGTAGIETVLVADMLQLALEERVEPGDLRTLSEPESQAVGKMCRLIEENPGAFEKVNDFTLAAAADALEGFVVEHKDKAALRLLQDEFFDSFATSGGFLQFSHSPTLPVALSMSHEQQGIFRDILRLMNPEPPKTLEQRTLEYLQLVADDKLIPVGVAGQLVAEWEAKEE